MSDDRAPPWPAEHGDRSRTGADGHGPGGSFRVSVPTDGDLSVHVVRSVAAVTGAPVSELPPLAESVDPDALERLAGGSSDTDPAADLGVSFTYAGCRVRLSATELSIQDRTREE